MLNRNEIYNSLLELIATAHNFKEVSRRPKTWQECSNKPALFLEEQSELANSSVRGGPIKWTLSVELIVYTQTGSSTKVTPFDELNNIIDKIIDLFDPSKIYGGVQKVGGLVESCYIEGAIEKYGNNSDMTGAIAIIPIKMVVANR